MKKLVTIMFVVGLIFATKPSSGQGSISPFFTKTAHMYGGWKYNSEEYYGGVFGLSLNNIKNTYKFDRNFYFGIVVTYKANVGAEIGCLVPLVEGNKCQKNSYELDFKYGLEYNYRTVFHTNNGVKLYNIVDSSSFRDKMVGSFQLGLNFRIGRFNFYTTANPGCIWTPMEIKDVSTRNTNFRLSLECGINLLVGNNGKSKKEEKDCCPEYNQSQFSP